VTAGAVRGRLGLIQGRKRCLASRNASVQASALPLALVDAEVLPALDVLVMPLVVHPVPMQDLSVSAIRTFPIFTYLSHDDRRA
jgi:hypothetical protein